MHCCENIDVLIGCIILAHVDNCIFHGEICAVNKPHQTFISYTKTFEITWQVQVVEDQSNIC